MLALHWSNHWWYEIESRLLRSVEQHASIVFDFLRGHPRLMPSMLASGCCHFFQRIGQASVHRPKKVAFFGSVTFCWCALIWTWQNFFSTRRSLNSLELHVWSHQLSHWFDRRVEVGGKNELVVAHGLVHSDLRRSCLFTRCLSLGRLPLYFWRNVGT